ncbi:flippase-like domain-containing protein [Pelagibius litoralis]|uniref:Flippase-like domain-containing protein n=1 Tax=Pelagibius litoralis TaxID=374515 RepID=A0A967KI22_9PROT|nr:flippase-like domain-containing protein [Pelagibius litoralis]NIA71851.1 flippase-like domain-containing protein [Pelagibius litoralis]
MMMRRLALPAFFLGLSLAIGVVAWQGLDDVAGALGRAGFQLLWLAPLFLIPLFLSALAWAAIFPPGTRPPLQRLCVASWIAVSINWLLPVAQIGGEIAKAAWLARRAAPAAVMAATTIVDKVLQTAGQALVALIGIALLLLFAGDSGLVPGTLAFAVLLLAFIPLFVYVQRRGVLLRLATSAERLFLRRAATAGGTFAERVAGLDSALAQTCAAPGRLVLHLTIRLVSRLVIAVEVWLTLHLMGYPIGILEAVMIESLAQTLRSAAFAVPGAYGVQEGGFILLGALVGVPAEIALSVSLAKRLRELLIGLPGLIYYQVSEGRRALGTGS